jgi:hypothetical protein
MQYIILFISCCCALVITIASAVSIDITYPINGTIKLSVNGVHKELGEESSLPHAPKVPIIIPALNQSSDAWRPLVLTECVEGMPPEFAPCLKRTFPNLVYAEEVCRL